MVKADPKKDYYADLEIPYNADADDIRKQFRKLALKWHPDRNPGNEAECVPKFQAIQAAHEILGDPDQKLKYDAERRKRGVYGTTSRASAPRGNPYQATSNFPPPPRRTARPQPQPSRPEYASTASHGASRFTNFPKPPPTSQKSDAKRNAEDKANVFKAWQNMNHRPKAPSQGAMPEGYARKSAWEAANETKPGMGRSNSTRVPRKGGFDPATPGADEPPATGTSSYYRRPVPPPPPSATSQQYPDPLKRFKETVEQNVPFAEGSTRARSPYNSMGGEKTFVDPLRRSTSQKNSSKQTSSSEEQSEHSVPRRSTGRHHSASPVGRKGNATRPFTMYSSSEDEEPYETAKPRYQTEKASRPQTAPNKQTGASANGHPTQADSTSNAEGARAPKAQPTIFTFPINPDTFNETKSEQSKSKSTDYINTTFSPKGWSGKFEGSTDYFTGTMPAQSSRPKTSPVRGRPQSAGQYKTHAAAFGASQFPPPQDQPSTGFGPSGTPGGVTTPGAVKFSKETWVQTFKDPSFMLPTNPPKPPSPAKGPTAPRRMKQPKSRANVKPQPASVTDDDDSSDDDTGKADKADVADENAMDIDPAPSESTTTNGAAKGPRMVPVPPSRPDWRNPQEQDKTTDDADTIRLGDLKNVAPFTASDEGLKDLNDLASTLPFESRPSASHPTRTSEAASLRLPDMPKAPEAPQHLTKSAWAEYVTRMGSYMQQFNRFDSHMLQHFAARQHEVEAMGTPVAWLGAVGDTTTGGGFGSYMQGVREDERARMHWNVGWEKHRTTMEGFEGSRARVLKGGLTG
ncbi:uncharacterized protein K452DRAFT_87840 [Aplosporella prunicola CBS 121167]|uniref:J domain-containing protein n=1 Tax=Aplosporella prunicola CBS 121167 TaxID=1176127 RepID=A0A6A6B3X9_9PEZI|nr:uncharacterized protein K452DRAFT_87840 [Aplosporella prunicola CBS 121167]KAF2138526.1 hypothetical protein K452DRAFT_87840 [Aplosporella prunicola CBS 121167]